MNNVIDHLQLRANGLEFHASAAGPDDGPLVLLLHGFPESSAAWRHQMAPLAEAGLRVVAPDQRGYGQTSKPTGRSAYRIDALADDVEDLARALGADRYAVVGHDWGGLVAWHLASRGAEGLERMAILNAPHPATMGSHTVTNPGQLFKSWYVGFFQLPALPELALAANDFMWLRNALVTTSRAGAIGDDLLRTYREDWARAGALTSMLNWYRALPFNGVAHGRIQVPVQIIWGRRDAFLDAALAERAAGMCDDARVLHLDEAGHWLHHEAPGKVNDALLRFLRPG
ncbi:alpha/beta fold hydrolase [Rhizobacter sp. LjRoot28]|jgi:pimeloyl-ACP methyl ester carboxylesterase|uniref:alpha/beta fold hydrolase n=1 Tax=Rhizobacter sp. LjRoot28 TaxID=3342309 RepID=UPI003ED16ECE